MGPFVQPSTHKRLRRAASAHPQRAALSEVQLCQKYSAYGLRGIQPVHPVAGCQHCVSYNTPGTLVLSVIMLWVLVSWQFFYCSDTYKAEWEISVNFHVSKISLHWFWGFF